jgi:hypothetical protein
MDTKTINLRDLPEELVRRAKVCAVLRGMTLKDFVAMAITKAVEDDIPVHAQFPMAAMSAPKSKSRKRS